MKQSGEFKSKGSFLEFRVVGKAYSYQSTPNAKTVKVWKIALGGRKLECGDSVYDMDSNIWLKKSNDKVNPFKHADLVKAMELS